MEPKSSGRNGTAAEIFIDVRTGGPRSAVSTKLGNVTVAAKRPSAERVKENVARSSPALKRVSGHLTQAGVFLPIKRGLPRYSVDEHDPQCIIRR